MPISLDICLRGYYRRKIATQHVLFSGILRIDDDIHKYVLHYIFLPRINSSVRSFIGGWNKHPMRTQRNWSPEQAYVNGILDLRNRFQTQLQDWYSSTNEHVEDIEWYGIDCNGPLPTDNDLPTVDLEELDSPLSHQQETALQTVDRMRRSDSYGIDIFVEALRLVLSN